MTSTNEGPNARYEEVIKLPLKSNFQLVIALISQVVRLLNEATNARTAEEKLSHLRKVKRMKRNFRSRVFIKMLSGGKYYNQ